MRRKKKNKGKRSRHIPKAIKDAVAQKHFFECAWDCKPIPFEFHHVNPFGEGGEHSVENLILLCSECHDLYHDGKIDIEELKLRNSPLGHVRGDRIPATFITTLAELKVRFGSISTEDASDLIIVGGRKIFGVEKLHNRLLVTCNLYNKADQLYLWMSNNRYWVSDEYTVSFGIDFFEITRLKDDQTVIRLYRDGNELVLDGNFYCRGVPHSIHSPDHAKTNVAITPFNSLNVGGAEFHGIEMKNLSGPAFNVSNGIVPLKGARIFGIKMNNTKGIRWDESGLSIG
jgi:hypothetical protein